MERLFFTINELTARAAKEANSMSGYVAGSATSEYQNMVNRVYDTVEKIKEKKPNLAERHSTWQRDTAASWQSISTPITETKQAVRQS